MKKPTVISCLKSSVLTITLNRPTVLNALDLPIAEALLQTIQMGKEESEVRVVMITGAGRGFCAGGDMKSLWEHVQHGGNASQYLRDLTALLHRITLDLRLMEKPVIAIINGVTSGAGMSYATACDLRLAGESAAFKQAFTTIGLTPDSGWTTLVSQIIGVAKASELLMLNPLVDANRALKLGLVHDVIPDEKLIDRAQEIATILCKRPQNALSGAKALLNAMLLPILTAQLERERQQIIERSGTAEFMEQLTHFVNKQLPGQ